MAQILQRVQPGDLVTANLMNLIAESIEDLDERLNALGGPAGPVSVPNVFGKILAEAKAILTQPTQQLTLGNVLDAFGNTVNPNLTASNARIVINQIPAPGNRAFIGSSVNLVVAAVAGTGPAPTQSPIITGFVNPTTNAPQPQTPIGQQVKIVGQNFAVVPANNQVFFNGFQAAPPSSASNPLALVVVIPEGISDAPDSPGETLEVTARVVVTTSGGSAIGETSALHTILPPLAGPPNPVINSVAPSLPTVGQPMTITGQNFGADLSVIKVRFDNVEVSPSSVTSGTQLAVTVPTNIPGLPVPSPGGTPSLKSVNLVVKIDTRESVAFAQLIQRVN